MERDVLRAICELPLSYERLNVRDRVSWTASDLDSLTRRQVASYLLRHPKLIHLWLDFDPRGAKVYVRRALLGIGYWVGRLSEKRIQHRTELNVQRRYFFTRTFAVAEFIRMFAREELTSADYFEQYEKCRHTPPPKREKGGLVLPWW